MARKINLRRLHETGELTVSGFLEHGASSDGVAAMFDDDETGTSLNLNSFFAATCVFTFSEAIQGKKIIIKVKTTRGKTLSCDLNVDLITENTIGSYSISDVNNTFTSEFTIQGQAVKKFILSALSDLTDPAVKISNVEMIILEEADPYEFNDSVLTTKAWNSSRYDGRQLQASRVNRFSRTDIGNNNKTPIIQNYTRNIYLGNEIIGLDVENPEDTELLQFENFSYLQVNSYITINDDETFTISELESTEEDNENSKIGWYRSFYDDFPIRSRARIQILDNSVPTQLKSGYTVYFNGGQLKKVARIATPDTHFKEQGRNFAQIQEDRALTTPFYNFFFFTGSQLVKNAISTSSFAFLDGLDQGKPVGGSISDFNISNHSPHDCTIFNLPFLDQIEYSESFDDVANTTRVGDDILEASSTRNLFRVAKHLVKQRNETSYKGNSRIFMTFTQTGSDAPIRTTKSGSVPNGHPFIFSNDLAELSTGEITDFLETAGLNVITQVTGLSNSNPGFPGGKEPVNAAKHRFHFNYSTGFAEATGSRFALLENNSFFATQYSASLQPFDHVASPPIFERGRIFISRLVDDNPSLLVNLPKTNALASGIGDKGFVVIPSNLHPYIKDNITHFLMKAGIDIGDRKETPVLKEKNKPKERPQLTPEQMRARMLARLAAFEAERERNMLPREERRQRRQERREERRENRQERREDRQERRRNRRRNRRRRR